VSNRTYCENLQRHPFMPPFLKLTLFQLIWRS